jgi:hypothetical protein
MKRFITLLIVLFTYSTLFAQKNSDTVAEHYKTSLTDCAIFPGRLTVEELYKDSSRVFTPTHSDVNLAEQKLRNSKTLLDSLNSRYTLIAGHLRKYKQQYFGYIDSNRHKILLINCFRVDPDDPTEFDDWLHKIVRVCDGAANFWTASFDMTK